MCGKVHMMDGSDLTQLNGRRQKVTKFVLASTQRSGSTWVIDVLNSHPAVGAFEELFLKGKESLVWAGAKDVQPWHVYWVKRQSPMLSVLRPYFHFKYLGKVYTSEESAIDAIGFKLMYGQLWHHPEILAYMRLNKVHIIHLVRENWLDVILSYEARKIRGVAHAYGKVEKVRIHLETSSLLDRLEWQESKIQWARRILSRIGLPYLEIAYEDLLSKETRFSTILDFLGIHSDQQDLKGSLEKLNRGSHQELIENYDSVQRILKDSKYNGLLH